MKWESIDSQSDLDALCEQVCWLDAEVIETSSILSTHQPHYPDDINYSGHINRDITVLVSVDAAPADFIELTFVSTELLRHSGDMPWSSIDLLGRVDFLMGVELNRHDGIWLKCARILFRWRHAQPLDG